MRRCEGAWVPQWAQLRWRRRRGSRCRRRARATTARWTAGRWCRPPPRPTVQPTLLTEEVRHWHLQPFNWNILSMPRLQSQRFEWIKCEEEWVECDGQRARGGRGAGAGEPRWGWGRHGGGARCSLHRPHLPEERRPHQHAREAQKGLLFALLDCSISKLNDAWRENVTVAATV